MSKQLIGTSLYALSTQINLKIPVAESFLPVQSIKSPNQDLPKQVIYSNDARNAHFSVNISCSDGLKKSQKSLEFSKDQMTKFFEKIQKIQDQLNTYM